MSKSLYTPVNHQGAKIGTHKDPISTPKVPVAPAPKVVVLSPVERELAQLRALALTKAAEAAKVKKIEALKRVIKSLDINPCVAWSTRDRKTSGRFGMLKGQMFQAAQKGDLSQVEKLSNEYLTLIEKCKEEVRAEIAAL